MKPYSFEIACHKYIRVQSLTNYKSLRRHKNIMAYVRLSNRCFVRLILKPCRNNTTVYVVITGVVVIPAIHKHNYGGQWK